MIIFYKSVLNITYMLYSMSYIKYRNNTSSNNLSAAGWSLSQYTYRTCLI